MSKKETRLKNGRFPKGSGKPASGIPAKGKKIIKHLEPARIANLKKIPKDTKEQNKLANEMMAWTVKHSQSFNINDFPISKNMSPYRFFKIADKNEYFAECLEFARHVMLSGMNWVNLKDPTTYTMKRYSDYEKWWDRAFKKHDRELIELRKQKPDSAVSDNAGSFKVIMEVAADSPLVPKKVVKTDE